MSPSSDKIFLSNFAIMLLYSFFSCLAAVLVSCLIMEYVQSQQAKIVALDLNKIKKDFMLKLATSDVDDNKLSAKTKDFIKALDLTLEKIASDNNLIILLSGDVIGVQDITNQVHSLSTLNFKNLK